MYGCSREIKNQSMGRADAICGAELVLHGIRFSVERGCGAAMVLLMTNYSGGRALQLASLRNCSSSHMIVKVKESRLEGRRIAGGGKIFYLLHLAPDRTDRRYAQFRCSSALPMRGHRCRGIAIGSAHVRIAGPWIQPVRVAEKRAVARGVLLGGVTGATRAVGDSRWRCGG